ncbi:MAG TPA: ABC transporter permease [Pirellulales bacterium]|nr:ABC transporter permease [Pirellulales bacterium]
MKKETAVLLVFLVALCAVTTAFNHRFLSPANLTNLTKWIGVYGVFSIGGGLVIITGGIDLSVGSMLALAGVLLCMELGEWHWPWPVAVLSILLLPMVLGWIHGLLITRMNLQPFIVTLCGLLLYRGVARFIADDGTKGFGDAEGIDTLRFVSSEMVFRSLDPETHKVVFPGIPMPFVILILVAIVAWIALHRSVYGRYLFAVGKNEQAARFSGINTRRIISSTYVISGLLAGVSSIMLAFCTNSVSPSTHGNFYELYGIAAAVLGGCSLRGGEGSIVGIVLGTAILQVLQNLVNLLGIPSSLNFAVMGAVVLVGVLADQILQKRAKKRLIQQRA